MRGNLAQRWYGSFADVLESNREAVRELRDASLQSDLGRWTTSLTGVVVASFNDMGFPAAAKGHKCKVLPIRMQEYLSLDVMGFPKTEKAPWRFPLLVAELENSQKDDRVAYSLWKVMSVRAALRIVFCYRPAPHEGPTLVGHLGRDVVAPMSAEERTRIRGQTLVAVGSRNESRTFPYGFFRSWLLNRNTGRFEPFSREA